LFAFGLAANGALGHSEYMGSHVTSSDGEKILACGAFQSTPRQVDTLITKKVVSVAAGLSHTVVCTHLGDVYSFGKGTWGQLGHGEHSGMWVDSDDEEEYEEVIPRLVDGLKGEKVVRVAAGTIHSAVCTEDGKLFTFGHGSVGELGHGDATSAGTPQHVEALEHKHVVGMAAGRAHTLVCTEDGEVYSTGMNDRGQLGRAIQADSEDDSSDEEDFAAVLGVIDSLKTETICSIACGHEHSVVCTDSGKVYTFGAGEYGQLGHAGAGADRCEFEPRLVQGLEGQTVALVAAGCTHTAVATAEGSLYTWGDGTSGQLGVKLAPQQKKKKKKKKGKGTDKKDPHGVSMPVLLGRLNGA